MTKKYKCLIVGYGFIGQNTHKDYEKGDIEFHIYDKYKKEFNTKQDGLVYDFAFICVNTELLKDGMVSQIEIIDAVTNNDAKVYVIKSTCPVGNIEQLKQTFPDKEFVYSPEYYGATQHAKDFDNNGKFTILGGDKKSCLKVQQMLQTVFNATHTFHITDSKTAELTKFMVNSWLAYKVSFCSAFYEICKQAGVNYEELRELFVLDTRINPAHTYMYDDHPYWKSHCFDKDVPSVANQFDSKLLKDMFEFNENMKKKYSK